MLTPDDIAAIPLFSTLAAESLQRLARTSADLRLDPGEFAVPEGGERALYAVLSGRIEVVKTYDGVERTLGWRLPGTIFGEVPLALGTPFPGGYRAAEPSRVMRIEVQEYYAVAALSEEIALKVGALARERMGGLQSIAAEAPAPRATLVGQQWDVESGELRRFLARNQISFEWLKPDAPELERDWPEAVGEDGPMVRLQDGEVLVRPQIRTLAERLGLQTCPGKEAYDVAIIGGGPAGLAAAVYGASEGLRTIVIEREAPGGQAGTSSRIENYLGFPSGISGDELASRALQQSRRLGAEVLVTRHADRFDPATRKVALDGGDVVRARAVILATGVSWRRLAIEGFDRLIGKGVYYGAARSEAGATHGMDVHIIGAGNSGRPGRAVLRRPRPHRDPAGARRRHREEHVALSGRAVASQGQHRRAPALGGQGRARRHPPDRDRRPRGGQAQPLRQWGPIRVHRRRRGNTLAAAADRLRCARLYPDRRRAETGRPVVAGPRSLPLGDQRPRRVRLRRRPPQPGQAGRSRGG